MDHSPGPPSHGTKNAIVRQSRINAMTTSRGDEQTLDYEADDVRNPREWHLKYRILVSLGPIIAAFVVCFANPVYIASIPGVIEEFHIGTTLAISPISLYALGLAVGPIITASVSELFGRKIIFFIALPLSLAFTIIGGSAHNFATLAVARFFASLTGSPCVTVTIGVLNDIWDVEAEKIGTILVVVFAAMMVWATEVGPPVGASIVQDRDWRWSFWITAILLAVSILIVFPAPETYKPEILRKIAKKRGIPAPPRGDFISILLVACGRPLHMLAVEPLVLPTALVVAISQAVVFCFYVAFPLVFERIYSFTEYQTGLAFLPLLVGSIVAIPIVAFFDKTKYQTERAKAQLERRPVNPESRLYPAMIGSVLAPISLFWLAWTARPSVHWAAPLLSGVPFGCAFVLVQLAIPVYKNDVYGTHFGASALAADNIIRYLLSAAMPLFTVQMIRRLGFDWAISLLAFVTVVLFPIPWIIFHWGPKLRARSRYVKMSKSMS